MSEDLEHLDFPKQKMGMSKNVFREFGPIPDQFRAKIPNSDAG